MNKFFILLLIPVGSFAQSKSNDRHQIKAVMEEQQIAWNAYNLEAFMNGYWKSDSLKFIGRNGITYGWQTTLSNYKKNYPTPEAMGKLTFTIVTLDLVSPDAAFMIGKYHLKRISDEPSGYFTLFWRKINGKWIIVVDHTS
jgi:ketosteroid isomerase-like protein